MMTVAQAFDLALKQHQAGRLVEAETLYRQILAAEPRHADALHLLGVIALQVGRPANGLDSITKAIALAPGVPVFHCNQGEAYRKLGRLDEAIAAYHHAIALKPDYAEALNNLGIVLEDKGQLDEAIANYHRAIALQPDFTAAHYNLGNALKEKGHLDEAIAAYRQAIILEPNRAEAYSHLGNLLKKGGDLDGAIQAHRQAVALKPGYAEAHYNLGNALIDQGLLDEAVAAYRQASILKPGYAEAHNNLGVALFKKDHFAEANAAYRQAIALKPEYAEAYKNLGKSLAENGQFDEALEAFHRVLQYQPEDVDTQFDVSLLLLSRGEFDQGWPLYEARWHSRHFAKPKFSQPMWDGGNMDGRRLLIHAEQGFGDVIQFIRYAASCRERGAVVIVECQRPLLKLISSMPAISEWVSCGDPLPSFDAHIPIMSLPLTFRTTYESIPAPVPYLSADAQRTKAWGRLLSGKRDQLRVGLAWAGNPQNRRDRRRSIPLEALSPLLRQSGIEFHSLQLGENAAEGERWQDVGPMVSHIAEIQDFADTAALMTQLDLIISVDTAVAHLAGALGRPVWTLLPFVPDWRWGVAGETTPWYPTMRLFRQPALGDWPLVIQRVAEELRKLAEAHTAGRPAAFKA